MRDCVKNNRVLKVCSSINIESWMAKRCLFKKKILSLNSLKLLHRCHPPTTTTTIHTKRHHTLLLPFGKRPFLGSQQSKGHPVCLRGGSVTPLLLKVSRKSVTRCSTAESVLRFT